MFGLESWKPVIGALLITPVPMLFLLFVGARTMTRHRGAGFFLVLLSAVLLYLAACSGTARVMQELVLRPPRALGLDAIERYRTQAKSSKAGDPAPAVIVVLGGGRERFAPEYGMSTLTPTSMSRLRYGLWLGRETGLPVAFSGGVGWAQEGDAPEAEVAARIAREEFRQPLRWTEAQSRDTAENAAYSLAVLRQAGTKEIVLVTHAVHMNRALRAFEQEAGASIRVTPAPLGRLMPHDRPALEWLPSAGGLQANAHTGHELLGLAWQKIRSLAH
jgi:uncharacterized SAM-binding protein YcdF (DUF218 family)